MDHPKISTKRLKSIMVGSYAWLTAISFGMVLLDILYAGLTQDAQAAFREAADFILSIDALTLLAALGAIGSSLEIKPARNLLALSLGLIILGFLVNITISPILGSGSSLGPVIRIVLSGSVSVLASTGFFKYCIKI